MDMYFSRFSMLNIGIPIQTFSDIKPTMWDDLEPYSKYQKVMGTTNKYRISMEGNLKLPKQNNGIEKSRTARS